MDQELNKIINKLSSFNITEEILNKILEGDAPNPGHKKLLQGLVNAFESLSYCTNVSVVFQVWNEGALDVSIPLIYKEADSDKYS